MIDAMIGDTQFAPEPVPAVYSDPDGWTESVWILGTNTTHNHSSHDLFLVGRANGSRWFIQQGTVIYA